jgi:hypothetical protein
VGPASTAVRTGRVLRRRTPPELRLPRNLDRWTSVSFFLHFYYLSFFLLPPSKKLDVLLTPSTGRVTSPSCRSHRLVVLPSTWTPSLAASNHLLAVLLAPGHTVFAILSVFPYLDTKSCRLARPGHEVLLSRHTWRPSLAVSPFHHLCVLPDLDTGLHWTYSCKW